MEESKKGRLGKRSKKRREPTRTIGAINSQKHKKKPGRGREGLREQRKGEKGST